MREAGKFLTLIVDVGNTDTVAAVYSGRRMIGSWRKEGARLQSSGTFNKWIAGEFRRRGIGIRAISGSAVTSVVPSRTRIVSRALGQMLGRPPLVISASLNLGLRLRYSDPRKLGSDRLCGAVAAFGKFGGPVIVVDCGTATTITVVSREGVILGGSISAGVRTSARALSAAAARLPELPIRFPRRAIGTGTVEAMQSGILYAAVDSIDGMIRRIKRITGVQTHVVLTGGWSALLRREIRSAASAAPRLVLDGALEIYLINRSPRRH